MKFWPFKIVKDPILDKPLIELPYIINKKTYLLEELLAMELKYLKKTATNYLGKEVKDAIIGIPAYFNRMQR